MQTDKHATLYYRISEDTVAMGQLFSMMGQLFSTPLGDYPLVSIGLPITRAAVGCVLVGFYWDSYSSHNEHEWVAADYGSRVARDDDCDNCELYTWIMWVVLFVMMMLEAFFVRHPTRIGPIFPLVFFCVLPPPYPPIEKFFVMEGLGDPFRAMATIYLCKLSRGTPSQALTKELLVGLMIVSHDRLFYGPAPLIAWTALYQDWQDFGEIKTIYYVAFIVSLTRFFLHNTDTTCLLVTATALEAVILSALIVLSAISEAGHELVAWSGGPNQEAPTLFPEGASRFKRL